MLIPFSGQGLNASAATPAWLRMPSRSLNFHHIAGTCRLEKPICGCSLNISLVSARNRWRETQVKGNIPSRSRILGRDLNNHIHIDIGFGKRHKNGGGGCRGGPRHGAT